jgi:hypothetical protein
MSFSASPDAGAPALALLGLAVSALNDGKALMAYSLSAFVVPVSGRSLCVKKSNSDLLPFPFVMFV